MNALQTIEFQLHYLFEYETVNGFLVDFYGLMFDELNCAEQVEGELCDLFSEFLDLEISHHQAREMSGADGPMHGEELTAIGAQAAEAIESILSRLLAERLRPVAVQELLAAECEYYLRRVGQVILHVQRAIEAGCESPIAYFSLGYNQFDLAMRPVAAAGDDLVELPSQEIEQTIHLCTDAVRSLGRGLRDEPFDGQIYYWIGLIAETFGANDHARHAFDLAVEADEALAPVCQARGEEPSAMPRVIAWSGPLTEFQQSLDDILSRQD